MKPIIWTAFACAVVLFTSCGGDSSTTRNDIPQTIHDLPPELANIPDGIEILHRPDTVFATINTKDPDTRGRYKWGFETAVKSAKGDLDIQEFGAYVWIENRWAFSTLYNRPYNVDEFTDWYNCPYGELKEGLAYTDHDNWTKGNHLDGDTTYALWYFIAKNKVDELVKGAKIVCTINRMKPNGN